MIWFQGTEFRILFRNVIEVYESVDLSVPRLKYGYIYIYIYIYIYYTQ
jgi:hypothetical protein